MTMGLAAMLLGAAAGFAAVMVLVAVLAPAPVNLVVAISRLDARRSETTGPTPDPVHWWTHVVAGLTQRASRSTSRWWGLPKDDLDLLGRTATGYIVRRLTWAGGGLVVLGLLGLAAGLGALAGPLAVAGALVGSVVPAALVRRAAVRAREEWRRAVTAYLDLVAQERASGAAPTQAVTEAAAVAQGWVFRRIRAALIHARRVGVTPWDALSRLGKRYEVTALVELADIVSSAAEGAAVYTTLTAKAASLRNAALNDDREVANRRSEKLVGPLACLLVGFVILIVYPMFARL